jgi:uncharacterized membrane protein
MKQAKPTWPLLGLVPVALAFALAVTQYGRLPEQVAVHWNLYGVADGFGPRLLGGFGLPFLMIVVYLLLGVLPRFDPRAGAIARFDPAWRRFIFGLESFLLYLYVLTLHWNIRGDIDFTRLVSLGLGCLLYVVADLMLHAEPNHSIGLRTPWTMASDEVWRRTHYFSGRLLTMAGHVIVLAAILIPFLTEASAPLLFVIAVACLVGSFMTAGAFSYIEYRRITAPVDGEPPALPAASPRVAGPKTPVKRTAAAKPVVRKPATPRAKAAKAIRTASKSAAANAK